MTRLGPVIPSPKRDFRGGICELNVCLRDWYLALDLGLTIFTTFSVGGFGCSLPNKWGELCILFWLLKQTLILYLRLPGCDRLPLLPVGVLRLHSVWCMWTHSGRPPASTTGRKEAGETAETCSGPGGGWCQKGGQVAVPGGRHHQKAGSRWKTFSKYSFFSKLKLCC